jgi:hypothetical protein
MSALGHEQTSRSVRVMSDIAPQSGHSSARFARPLSAISGSPRPTHVIPPFPESFAPLLVKRFLQQVAKTKRSPARASPAAALRSINHAEEFLARQRIVTEAAQHSASDEVCVRLMHAARGHAVMRRL